MDRKKKKNLKISSTPYRVLTILYLLNDNKYTLDELIDYLSNDKLIARTFSKDVILKYLNTLKLLGFNITKHSGTNISYQLTKAPFLLDIKESEVKTLAFISNYVNNLYQPNLILLFNNFINKIERFLSQETSDKFIQYKKEYSENIDNSFHKFSELLKLLEKSCIENHTVQIKYSPLEGLEQNITFEPENIKYKNQIIYICGNNVKISHKQYLQLDYIKDIKYLPSKAKQQRFETQVNFKLTGRLAKSYRLYENEKVIQPLSLTNTLIINASVIDVDILLNRLLKYGPNCEVLSPASVRSKMHDLITDLMKLYSKESA